MLGWFLPTRAKPIRRNGVPGMTGRAKPGNISLTPRQHRKSRAKLALAPEQIICMLEPLELREQLIARLRSSRACARAKFSVYCATTLTWTACGFEAASSEQRRYAENRMVGKTCCALSWNSGSSKDLG